MSESTPGTVHSPRRKPRMPKSVAALWRQGWVAENEDEAVAQAERMYDLFAGKAVSVDRLEFPWNGELDEWIFKRPWPKVWVVALSTERGWDGDVLYPEWEVRPVNSAQVVTDHRGRKIRLGDIEDLIFTTAPGVGTAKGFAHKDALVYPLGSGEQGGQQ